MGSLVIDNFAGGDTPIDVDLLAEAVRVTLEAYLWTAPISELETREVDVFAADPPATDEVHLSVDGALFALKLERVA